MDRGVTPLPDLWLLCFGVLLPWLAVGETRTATELSIGDGGPSASSRRTKVKL